MDQLKRVIFFDRDDTLIEDVPYNSNPDRIVFKPDVIDTLIQLNQQFQLIIITNQSGVARGLLTIGQVEHYMSSLLTLLESSGVKLLDYYYSPYFQLEPQTQSNIFNRTTNCRKPGADLFLLAAREHKIDLSQSYMVGDRLSDIQAAFNAGIKPILVNYQKTELEYKPLFAFTEISEFRMLLNVIK